MSEPTTSDPIEECWGEIRPPREAAPEVVPETQTLAFETETSGLSVENKSELCVRIATRLLNNTPNWTLIEDQALNFMSMTDEAVLETAQRVGIRLVVTTPNSRSREQELINELNAKIHY
jgi:hypothetical protein